MLKIEFGFGVGLDQNGNIIPEVVREAAIAGIRSRAVELFGGVTLTPTKGDWKDLDTGSVFSEEGRTLFVIVDPVSLFPHWSDATLEDRISGLARDIKEALNQKAVYVTRYPVQSALY